MPYGFEARSGHTKAPVVIMVKGRWFVNDFVSTWLDRIYPQKTQKMLLREDANDKRWEVDNDGGRAQHKNRGYVSSMHRLVAPGFVYFREWEVWLLLMIRR